MGTRLICSTHKEYNMVNLSPVKSSNIDAVGYDKDKKELHVSFKGSGRYVFEGVPAEKHDSLIGAPSVGKYFSDNIRAVHAGRKIEQPKETAA